MFLLFEIIVQHHFMPFSGNIISSYSITSCPSQATSSLASLFGGKRIAVTELQLCIPH
jgi:hypothetical protein